MKSGRVAHGVALWVFDLDGLSPLLGKEHARVRGCYALGTFKDAYACECSCHGRFPSCQMPAPAGMAALWSGLRRQASSLFRFCTSGVSPDCVSQMGKSFSLYNPYQPARNPLGEKRAFINQPGINLDQ